MCVTTKYTTQLEKKSTSSITSDTQKLTKRTLCFIQIHFILLMSSSTFMDDTHLVANSPLSSPLKFMVQKKDRNVCTKQMLETLKNSLKVKHHIVELI